LEKYDLAVVGAGPAGSMAAYRAAKLGLKVLILEEHGQAGSPPHCAGKLSVKAFQEFSLPSQCILNEVRGALFHSPGNLEIEVSKSNPESYIIDRELFDRRLAEEAVNAGAEAVFKCKVKQVDFRPSGGLTVKGSSLEVKVPVLIIAEGGTRKLSRSLGFQRLPVLKGIQAEMEDVSLEREDFVEVFFGWKFSPGFFGWLIPTGEGKARIGLCLREDMAEMSPRAYLEKMLREYPPLKGKVAKARMERVYGGLIPVEGPVKRMWHPKGVMVVGDAAGHAKSTTGGGVLFGLKAGWLAGEAASRLAETGRVEEALRGYQQACLKAFGGELSFTKRARRFLNRLSDGDLDQFFRFLSAHRSLLEVAERRGDTAYQSKVWKPMLKASARLVLEKPSTLKFAGKMLWKILQSMV